MNGLDQIVITLWFLPVVLFIIVPLLIGLTWAPISFLIGFLKRETEQERQFQSTVGNVHSTA